MTKKPTISIKADFHSLAKTIATIGGELEDEYNETIKLKKVIKELKKELKLKQYLLQGRVMSHFVYKEAIEDIAIKHIKIE